MSFMQRRRHQRFAVSIPVKVITGDGASIPGDIEDISLGGAFIRVAQSLPVGEKIRIEINFSGMHILECEVKNDGDSETIRPPEDSKEAAVVRWAENGNGMGVEFTALNLATQHFLNKMIEHLRAGRTS